MRLLSLFSGIGAFEKALKNIGIPFELAGYCEIDKFASKAYCRWATAKEQANNRWPRRWAKKPKEVRHEV